MPASAPQVQDPLVAPAPTHYTVPEIRVALLTTINMAKARDQRERETLLAALPTRILQLIMECLGSCKKPKPTIH